jgi:hypothetical protein
MKEKKQSKNILKKAVFVLIIATMITGVTGLSGCTELNKYFQPTTSQVTTPTTISTTTGCATFQITPSVTASEGKLSSDETTITVAAIANTTAHTITENDNTTWVNPVITFVIKPAVIGNTETNVAYTLNYEVVTPDITTTDGTDTYPLFTKTSGKRQCIWTGDGTQYVSGHTSLTITQNATLTLTLTCSQDSYSRIEKTYDPIRVPIRFWNDCGWSQTYYAEFMLIEAYV